MIAISETGTIDLKALARRRFYLMPPRTDWTYNQKAGETEAPKLRYPSKKSSSTSLTLIPSTVGMTIPAAKRAFAWAT